MAAFQTVNKLGQYPLQSAPMIPIGQQRQGRDWVVLGSTRNNVDSQTTGMRQTKLLFNEAFPASTSNRATCLGPPAAIVIEKLLPLSGERENVESTRNSFKFTSLSEEKLQAAVKLAKRDLRRRRLLVNKSPAKPSQGISFFETSDEGLLQELATNLSKTKLTTSSPKEKATRPGAKQSTYTSQKHHVFSRPLPGRSPPTRDPGPRPRKAADQKSLLGQEICKLQTELENYILKVEQLANRGEKLEDPLEPEEQTKLEVRRQKQAARSARSIYVLQQQVKEIQEDMEKLRYQKMWDTKKSTAINKLAAAHRGTLRALQVFIHQHSDLSHGQFPPHCKELGQLIRQLSLCSAKVEVEQGSAVPEIALNILQKLETLDSAFSKQEMLQKMQARACPPRRKSPHLSMSPTNAPKGPTSSTVRGTRKPTNPKRSIRGRKIASQKPKIHFQPSRRGDVLRAGLERLAQQRELRELHGRPQTNRGIRKGTVQHCHRSKADLIMKGIQMQDAGFQQPTVSSRLRVNQLPQKEHSVPWIPTSPHSPPQQRSPQRRRPEPRCLFSPVKPSPSPLKQKVAGGSEGPVLSSDKKSQAQNEALRNAWLDKMTMQRLKELNQLSREEAEHIQRLRSEVVSPTQWAETAEQKAREKIQPLLDEAQINESRGRIRSTLKNRLSEQAAERAAESADQLSEALLEDLLEDSARAAWAAETDRQLEGIAQRRLQAPTLESMLLRMEEIQKDQEEVRRRFASITYSDPLSWGRPGLAGPQRHDSGSSPASPQPIRLTRPMLRQHIASNIVLEKPVETGHSILSENSLTEEASQQEQQPRRGTVFPGPVERSTGTVICVPGSMLRSIRGYREEYDTYMRVVADDPVGGFNPWAIADSLAEEFLSEALTDMAAEFQDVVEEYAEAIFTSEFLQLIQSPPASAPGSTSK